MARTKKVETAAQTPKAAKPVEFNANQRTIIGAIGEANKVKVQSDRLNERKKGVYATFTAIAADVAKETFAADMDTVFNAVRDNVDGIAVELKCKPGKKAGTYVVPGSAMSAKSVLLSAYDYKVPLLDMETGEVRAFGNIRDDVKAMRDAEAKAEQGEDKDIRDQTVATLHKLADMLASMSEVDPVQADHMAALGIDLDTWANDFAAISGEVDEEEPAPVEEVAPKKSRKAKGAALAKAA